METLKISLSDDTREVNFRTGEAPKIADPVDVAYKGDIHAPANYFRGKHKLYVGEGEPAYPRVLVIMNLLKGTIELRINDQFPPSVKVNGALKENPYLTAFMINTDKRFSIEELKTLLRKNRHFFVDKEEQQSLLARLEKFKATITTNVDNQDDRKGNSLKALQRATDVGGDFTFKLCIALFQNEEERTFLVECLPDPTDAGVRFLLDSPELFELDYKERERILGEATLAFDEHDVTVIRE